MGRQSHFPCLPGDLRVRGIMYVFFVNEVEAGVLGGLHVELAFCLVSRTGLLFLRSYSFLLNLPPLKDAPQVGVDVDFTLV